MPLIASPPPDAYVRSLIDVLHEATDRAGLTQEQVGDAIGISQQTVSRLWAHRRSINVQELFVLSDRLGLDAAELISRAQKRVTDDSAVDLEREAVKRRREKLLGQLREERQVRRKRSSRRMSQQAG